MTYLEFVEKIKTIPSQYEAYLGRGLTDEFINNEIQSYFAKPKFNTVVNDDDNEVIKLINCFDLSKKLYIGDVNFLDQPIIGQEVVFFGEFAVDGLAIYEPTGEIRCYENQSDHLLWQCAKDGSLFLDALFEVGYFLAKRSFHENLINDEELGESMAEYCAEIAGGMQYKDFYWVMCC